MLNGKPKPKTYNKMEKLTWGIYGMEHNRRDFHRMDDDVQRKRLKRIHCCHDLTNNQKNHLVLAPQLCLTAALISNTNKISEQKITKKNPTTHACNEWIISVTVHTPTRWHASIIVSSSNNAARLWQKYAKIYLLLNVSFWINGWLWIQCWWISTSAHIFIFWIVASRWWKVTMLKDQRQRIHKMRIVCTIEWRVWASEWETGMSNEWKKKKRKKYAVD